jgi:hypothetical protein
MKAPAGRLALALTVALAVLALAAIGPAYVNHDAAWYLYMGGRWLDGATLYRDVVDTNPPLIIWLSLPPVLVAHALGAAAPAFFKAWVFLLAGISLVACWRIVRDQAPGLAFPIVAVLTFLVLPFVKADFGQREHFAVLLTLPYVLDAAGAGRRRSRAGEIGIGVAGGLGFAIKPHFLLAWIAVEAVVWLQERARVFRTASLTAAVTIAIYGVLVLVLTPAYIAVIQQVREVYGGLNAETSLLRLTEVQIWVAALVVLAAIRWRNADRLPAIVFAAATGYLGAALLQMKGWNYHLYPARVFLAAFLVIAASSLLEQVPEFGARLRGGVRGLALAFSLALVAWAARYAVEARHPVTADLVSPLIDTIQAHAPGGPVAVLSMRALIYPAFPAVNYTGARWSLRQNSMWFLPGLYAGQDRHGGPPLEPHAAGTMSATERVFFQQVEEDLCRTPPRLLVVEEPLALAPAGRRGIDFLRYYGQSPRLARLFSGYESGGRIGALTWMTPVSAPSCGP